MAKAPDRADQRATRPAPVPGHNGGDRHHVIGIGGVPHAEKEAEEDDGKGVVHGRQNGG
jgi:hypothetical protein